MGILASIEDPGRMTYNVSKIWYTSTVLPAKSDSDIMFYLQS